jgi:hypothetical protein
MPISATGQPPRCASQTTAICAPRIAAQRSSGGWSASIAAEEGGEHRGGDSDIDRRHALAHAVDVECGATHPAVLLGDEQQLDTELVAAHAAHERLWELVALVELDEQRVGQLAVGELGEQRVGQLAVGELGDRLERELQALEVEPGSRGDDGHSALPSLLLG